MDRWDISFMVTGVVGLLVIVFTVDKPEVTVGAALALPSLVLNVIQYRHGRRPPPSPPPPDLAVEYRNRRMGDRPVVWRPQVKANTSWYISCQLHVYVINNGDGPAEAVEVRFDSLEASDIWNESGNYAPDVDATVYPARFTGGVRILPPHREWCIAMLSWHTTAPSSGEATWQAFAKNMPPEEGIVRVEILDEPPPELRERA